MHLAQNRRVPTRLTSPEWQHNLRRQRVLWLARYGDRQLARSTPFRFRFLLRSRWANRWLRSGVLSAKDASFRDQPSRCRLIGCERDPRPPHGAAPGSLPPRLAVAATQARRLRPASLAYLP